MLRFNQVQVLASHNSYKLALYPRCSPACEAALPPIAAGLEYGHRPLAEQFDELGVRAIELDVYADPTAASSRTPGCRRRSASQVPDDPAMHEPGFKVIHQADIDTQRDVRQSLAICLTQVREWSDAIPATCR